MLIFLFGAGYSARAFASREQASREQGRAEAIFGTTRSSEKFDRLRRDGIEPFAFDGSVIGSEMADALRRTTHLVLSAAPEAGRDPFLRHADGRLRQFMPALRWVGYLSTVGVYGDHGGAWVDEESECRPVSRRSVERLEVEKAWQAAAEREAVPLAILRLAGIYGPGRNAFANLDAGTARRIVKSGQIFNRIHVGDIAGVLSLLSEREMGGVFNLADGAPSPAEDVVTFAAGLMGVEPPPEIPFEQAEMTPMARSFYGENKRVSNRKVKGSGYVFDWPDYRAAMTRMWAEGSWR